MELQETYIEKVKLVCGGANRVGEEEGIPLGPGDLLRRILETNTRAGHDHGCFDGYGGYRWLDGVEWVG
jgi:hypothetical protein